MSKRKKKQEVHMIDMTYRRYIKIVESTAEEEAELDAQLREMDVIIEERMRQYEIDLQHLIKSALSEDVVKVTDKDSEYFLRTYKDEFKHRNQDNIQRRFAQLKKYLENGKDVIS